MNALRFLLLAGAAGLLAAPPASAQAPASAPQALPGWVALHAPPGREHLATDVLLRALPGWERDTAGNLVRSVGRGRPRRVVACALDRPGLVVSQVTDEGYLRLHGAGNQRRHPLWDQFHEGQQVSVLTASGAVPGVVAIANGHFSRQHRADTAVVTVDQLWVDLGAASRAEVERMGVRLLDPVERELPPWRMNGFVVGPDAGGRAGCAALAAAARRSPGGGETVFLMTRQRSFGWVGLGAALSRLGPVDRVVLVGPGEEGGARRWMALNSLNRSFPDLPGTDSALYLAADVRFPGSLVESVGEREADTLLGAVAAEAGVMEGAASWIALPTPAEPEVPVAGPAAEAEALLTSLVELPGVPGHEGRVREAVLAALPAWARERATVDGAGNLLVGAGPERDTAVVIAHLDEVAFEVVGIAPDGTVALEGRGGVIPSAWEGQPALLHFDAAPGARAPAPLRGVFVPREEAREKRPRQVTAWFGMDAAALSARGVETGMGVTAYKRGVRLAGPRFTARSLDDRAGSTALVMALRRIDPERLDHRLVFAWSTGEEGGLVGARALAARLGPTVRRVYTVDTFVSSDTPLESPHFAFVPLGSGAVLRGLDDASFVPDAERERVLRIAREEGIPVREGTTHGSTDGSAFTFYGAVNVGLSWPGRYSHSPAEVLDLRDLDALARLIAAVATRPGTAP